jgi:hypothetical protein
VEEQKMQKQQMMMLKISILIIIKESMQMMKVVKNIHVLKQEHILNLKIYVREFIKSLKKESHSNKSFMEDQCF